MKIMIDAGHFGKTNKYHILEPKEYYESQMSWKLQNYLVPALKEYGFEVATTRGKQEVDLPVYERGTKSKGYDLLLSLHSNTCDTETVNRAVMCIFQTLDWTTIDDVSRKIGEMLGEVVKNTMHLSGYQLYQRKADSDRDKNGVKDDEYYGVLYGARKVGTPAVIIEHGFHTNRACANWLYSDDNLKTLAEAEAAALADYYGLSKKQAENPVQEIKEGSKITISKGAMYKGNIKKVPEKYIGKELTVSKISNIKGIDYALIKELSSWVEIKYLNCYQEVITRDITISISEDELKYLGLTNPTDDELSKAIHEAIYLAYARV